MMLKHAYMGWKFQRILKLDISFSLENFFISVAIFTQVASAPLSKKTKLMGLTLKKENLKNLGTQCSKEFSFWLVKLKLDWWLIKKSSSDVLIFYWTYWQLFTKNKYLCFIKVKMMKHFRRGKKLSGENFIDISSIYPKQSATLFCLKGECTASLKKQPVNFYGIA